MDPTEVVQKIASVIVIVVMLGLAVLGAINTGSILTGLIIAGGEALFVGLLNAAGVISLPRFDETDRDR